MSFAAFLKKEFLEIIKTSKIIVLPALFLFFGILSPLSAKYMNEILSMVGEQQGIVIKLPDPTFVQSYEQFFKNLYFMMIVVTILVFAGAIAEEKSKGTALLVLTKCLSRNGFLAGKILAAIALFTVSYVLSAAVCIYYTYLMFPEFMNINVMMALLLYWLFGLLMISMTLFSSLLSGSTTMAAVGGFVAYALVSFLAAIPEFGKYTPGALQAFSTQLVNGTAAIGEAMPAAAVGIILCACLFAAGFGIFNRQEI